MEILSAEKIRDFLELRPWLIMEQDRFRVIAKEAQKDTLRQVIEHLNMRRVEGGVNPEWAMSDKLYQELKKLAREDVNSSKT